MALTGQQLKELRERSGLGQKEFAEVLGYERSNVSRMENTDRPFSPTIEARIRQRLSDKFSHLLTDLDAAFSGFRKAKAGHSVASSHRVKIRGMLASVIDDLPEAIYDIFEVEGSSMETTLTQGDRLLCRADTVENIVDNRIYVLVLDSPELSEYRSSGIWIKRCNHRKANGYISCRSDNKDTTEPFPTFRIESEKVVEVWYPVLKITAHMADPNRDIYNRIDELENRIEMLEQLLNE